ncbi:MAG: hypothetical protein GXO22_07885 [Aquificae bacterium]|nr:hypothetical protein [Aquificota bacterium]
MRKINYIFLLLFIVLLKISNAQIYEYPVIYKDPRIMGRGGVNIALGGYSTSVLYNPASISLNKKNKYLVDMLRINLSYDENGIPFFNDIQDAVSTGDRNQNGYVEDDRLKEVLNVLNSYSGQTAHAGWDTVVAISRTGSDIAYSFGLLISTRYTAKIYKYSHTEGVINVYFDNYIVPFAGVSFNFFQKKLSLALLWKYIFRRSTYDNVSAREIAYKGYEIDSYIIDDLGDEGKSNAFDIGAVYRIPLLPILKPTLGISIQNIGNPDLGELGEFPQTINVGFGMNPIIKGYRGIKLGIDYIDITKNIDTDKDTKKRLRYGMEIKVIDNPILNFTVRTGIYQGYLTAGIEARLTVVSFIFTTYAEELGIESGQDKNRRYILSAGLSW